MAKESAFGTPVAASSFLPMTGVTMMPDPGLFSPKVMMGLRDANIFALWGQQKEEGGVDAPFFPTNGAGMFVWGLGYDALDSQNISAGVCTIQGFGITGSSVGGGWSTTTSGTVTAGATTVGVTSATGISAGQYFQINTNGSSASSEVHLILSIVSTTITLAAGETFALNHSSAVTIKQVQAPYTHTIFQGNSTQPLASFTLEKNTGNFQSLQFGGCRVNKMDLKAAATDTEAQITYDLIAGNVGIMDAPTASSYVDEVPFVFSEMTLTLAGQNLTIGNNFQMSLDNGLKPNWTFNQSHDLQFLTPSTLTVSGQIDIIWYSYDDSTYGYLKQALPELMVSGTNTPENPAAIGSLTFAMTHPAGDPFSPSAGLTMTMPRVYFSKLTDEIKQEDVIMQTLAYTAYYNIAGTAPAFGGAQTGWMDTMSATLVNEAWLPY